MNARSLALAAVLLLGVQGCTKVGGAAGGTAGNPWTHHGVLRIAALGDPDTLNPLIGTAQIITDLSMFWAGYLFNVDDRDRFVPELASEVPTLANGGISRDGRTIVYHLRHGVLWQDGRPFTAADVVFTWRAVMNPSNNVGSRSGYDLIRRIDVRDDHTIAVHLSRPNAPFVASFFTMSSTAYPVLPAHLLASLPDINRAAFNERPVGTGPFILDRWQHGQKLIFRANPHYWRGRPKLDRIEYAPIPDENTVLTQLESHEADLEFNAPSAQFAVLKSLKGFHLYLTPFTAFSQIAFNTRSALLGDVRVRRALAYATNDARIIATVTHGVGIPGDSNQPAFLWAHASGLPRYDYNPARARALLDAAGWRAGPDGMRAKGGQRLAPVISSITGSAVGNAAEIMVQRDWRDVGVDASVKNYVLPQFFSAYNTGGILLTGRFDAAFYAWYNGVDPDDSTQFMCDQIPPAGQNSYFLCDPTLDAAERVALTSYDLGVRAHAYDAIQRRLVADEPLIVMWMARRIDIANTDLRGFKPSHVVTDFWNSWEYQI